MKNRKRALHALPTHAFPVLDGLRGIAAISVVVFHYAAYITNYTVAWLPNAFMAVDFFFVLSGFVVAHAYEKSLLSKQGIGEFLQRRLVRLYPLYFLSLTLPLAVFLVQWLATDGARDVSSYMASYALGVFFLPTPPSYLPEHDIFFSKGSGDIFPLNSVAWTLSLEIGINLIYALICRWLTPIRLAVLLVFSSVSLAFAIRFYNTVDLGPTWSDYWGGWARVSWSFFVGVLLYRFTTGKKITFVSPWMAVFLCALLIADFRFGDASTIYSLLSIYALFPLVVWLGAKIKTPVFAQIIFLWLGKTSYPLYMMHMPLLPLLVFVSRQMVPDLSAHISLVIVCWTIVALLVSASLCVVYDDPVRMGLANWLRLGANKRKRAPG